MAAMSAALEKNCADHPYCPVLMRFNCPDSWSPFGGVNPYAYCAGDPVNHADPTGHHSVADWLGIGVGIALGVLLTPVSWGSSLSVALSVSAIATGVASAGLAVAQQFVEDSSPKLGAAWGWAALGTDLVSGLSSAALSKLEPVAKSLAGMLRGTASRPFGGLLMSGDEAGGSSGIPPRAVTSGNSATRRRLKLTTQLQTRRVTYEREAYEVAH